MRNVFSMCCYCERPSTTGINLFTAIQVQSSFQVGWKSIQIFLHRQSKDYTTLMTHLAFKKRDIHDNKLSGIYGNVDDSLT